MNRPNPMRAAALPRRLRLNRVLLAALPLLAAGASAAEAPRYTPAGVAEPLPATRLLLQSPYAGNAAVRTVRVEVASDGLPADGQSATAVVVTLLGADGQPLREDALITIEVNGGRVQLPGALTDELGPGRLDADRAVSGTQLKVSGGVARFQLVAPDRPMDVLLRVNAGPAQAEGTVSFLPELRPLLAVGLVEGVVRLSRRNPDTIQPVRLDDGFETELRQFSRSFDDGKGAVGARTAFFLKGRISGQALLTAAYDSDKETRARLLRDIKPQEFYPVYGDSSVKTFDAQSSSKLYVRVDQAKSYLLYGDFATGDGFSQPTGGGAVAPLQQRSLGAYSRTVTGVRGHWERAQGVLNAFATHDTLKQVTEELHATGTSGPFVLRNNSALENSEKVEVLTRFKDNPAAVKSVRALMRFDDYGFEPFSGRILLNRPLASVDADGDPVSLRITYEVDQGGDRFWTAGIDGQFNLTPGLSLGGALVEERNPQAPYKLGSVNLAAQLGSTVRLTAEVARSEATLWGNGGVRNTNPTFASGEQRLEPRGQAARIGLQHQDATSSFEASITRTDRDFFNPASPMQGGRSEASARGRAQIDDTFSVFGELLRSADDSNDGRRRGGALGVGVRLSDRLSLSAGVRKVDENAAWNGSGNGLIVPNAAPASAGVPTGGFFGGIDPVVVNPSTGQASTSYAALPATASAQGISVDATTLFVGAQFRATERVTLEGLAEGSVEGDSKHRVVLGAAYQVAERSRVYARYEDQSGVTSAYGAARSNAFSLGADTGYMPGGRLFSEYRLRDATSRESQWANGVRNTWAVREGVTYTTAAEYLKVLDGSGGSAAALALGYDYTAHPLWKLASKLELRRVFDNGRTPENDRSDSVLATVAAARKLDRDWTLLARNYLLANRFAQSGGGIGADGVTQAPGGAYAALQNRFQVGAAYRPVDNNRLDVLGKYELMTSRNAAGQVGLAERVHIGSVQAVFHPSRPWWLSGRLAAKSRTEKGLSADGTTRFDAVMLTGRAVYDITENWDLGVMSSTLFGRPGRSRQYAHGVEAGYLVQQNLWVSVGYNWRGFSDRDLSGSQYTNGGFFLRLRFKFDEDLLAGDNRRINRALDRAPDTDERAAAPAGARP